LLPLVSQLSLIAGQMESSFENVRVVDAELNRCRFYRAVALPVVKPASGVALELETVSFAFNGNAPILRDISMLLHEGEIAVLRGASGVGKTSILNIVSGVLQPTSGSVRVDRADLSYVPQEIALLDDSVRNNLLFGLPRMDDRNLMKALAVAQLDDFVASLPRGLDTGVGDNGALFSGGERQRFGLARAILRRSRLMLLDEATSALDEKNEGEVLRNLAESGVAILFVTHRRHAHRWAHRLYQLENGRLIEVAPATRAIDEFAVAALGRA
jgi:ABC-type multidrug transport system fused ATPase/permease subunit